MNFVLDRLCARKKHFSEENVRYFLNLLRGGERSIFKS